MITTLMTMSRTRLITRLAEQLQGQYAGKPQMYITEPVLLKQPTAPGFQLKLARIIPSVVAKLSQEILVTDARY